MTAFGPQSANAATALPSGSTTNRYGVNVDTWVRDCTDTVNNNGTVLNAAFFNNIIGNLRYLVNTAGCPLVDGDMTMVYDAVLKVVQANAITSVGPGLTITGNNLNLDLGAGTLTFVTA